MKKQNIIIALLLAILVLIFARKMSGYVAGSAESDRSYTFASINSAGTWVDIDESFSGKNIVNGGRSNDIDLNQVVLDNINWMMWAGSNVLSSGVTITLPDGVTPENVTGFRKKILVTADGKPYGASIQFLTRDFSSSMNRKCQVGGIWDAPEPIGRIYLPDYIIAAKSIQDPRDPIDCKISSEYVGCTTDECGATGKKQWKITKYVGKQYGGQCPPHHGMTVPDAGFTPGEVITTNEPCIGTACPVNCQYSFGDTVGCTVDTIGQTDCGKDGAKIYTVSGYVAPINNGSCPPDQHGFQVTGDGQYISKTEKCEAPACNAEDCKVQMSGPICPISATKRDDCGKKAPISYTILNFRPAKYNGNCPSYHGIDVATLQTGTWESTDQPCAGMACPFATAEQLKGIFAGPPKSGPPPPPPPPVSGPPPPPPPPVSGSYTYGF
jgi:hypothetical protein